MNGITVPGLEDYLARRDAARPRAVARTESWYRIENADGGDTATITIYDEIGWFGTTAREFIDELAAIDAASLDVHLNTPGGEVWDGVAIYNALMQHPATVTTTVDSLAASIGSLIAQAGDNRVMAKASQMMVHDPKAGAFGGAAELRKGAEMLDQVTKMIATVYADRGGGTVAFWRAAMTAESWYSAEEAKRAGLADAVYGDAPAEAVAASWDLSTFRHTDRRKASAPPMPAARAVARAGDFRWDPEVFRTALKEAFK
jgi:ATP-dependent protease ClpP protease subunit